MIARHARGIDAQHEDDLAATVTDDVVRQTQPWTQSPLVEKAFVPKALRNDRRACQGPRHCITNHQRTINDDGTAQTRRENDDADPHGTDLHGTATRL
jgi:hypothetical protein